MNYKPSEIFLAKYTENNIQKTICFSKQNYTVEKAEQYLKDKGIKNWFFFLEPEPPQQYGENGMYFTGEVGFDICVESLMPHINSGKEIILNSFGGDLWESWRIYDMIKLSGLKPTVGVIGICASAAIQILIAGEKRWASENSQMLIHNPWCFAVGDDQEMQNSATFLEKEKLKLANKYSEISGKSVDEILNIMKPERMLNPSEALDLNLINEIKTINPNDMNTKLIEDKITAFETVLNKVANLFIKKVKNLVKQDVNGVELDFGSDVTDESQIVVGVSATVAGVPAEGEYIMPSGETYSFEGGKLTEIKAAKDKVDPNTEVIANLRNEVLTLTNQLAESKAENNRIKNEFDTFRTSAQAEINQLKNDFTAIKNLFSGGNPPSNVSPSEANKTNRTVNRTIYQK